MPTEPKLSGLMRNLLGNRSPDADLPAAAMPLPPAQGIRRAKLWDLPDKDHCPVIGTCMRMDELSRFAKRFKFEADLRNEFALHVEAVNRSLSRNEVSEALQKYLDRKYDAWIVRFAKLKTDGEVRADWKACLARGEVAGPLWATCTHKAASAQTREHVYADIHMLSHQIGAGQAADARRLGYLEQENAEMKCALETQRKQHQRQVHTLQARLSELDSAAGERQNLLAQANLLRERVARLESGQVMVEMGRRLMSLQLAHEQTAAASHRAGELEQELLGAREQIAGLARDRDAAAAERDALERLLLADHQDGAGCQLECESCDRAQSARCILYVGGRISLVAQYRELAERLGVRLIHHDGGLEEALSRLPELIHGADAIVCPTDCISHSAYYSMKSHCKRAGKPCLFFKGAGVSSFAVAMDRLARGEYSLAGQAEEI